MDANKPFGLLYSIYDVGVLGVWGCGAYNSTVEPFGSTCLLHDVGVCGQPVGCSGVVGFVGCGDDVGSTLLKESDII